MKKHILMSISFIALTNGIILRAENQMLFMGSIQFPHVLESIPELRVYCKGHKIKCEKSNESRKLSFAIQDVRHRTSFYIVITNNIKYKVLERNTISHLIVDPKKPYKLYRVDFAEDRSAAEFGADDLHYVWRVQEQRLPIKNGRIPDDAIIICYNPDFIDAVKGGNAIELPTVHIKQNILSLLGSEEKLHDSSIELLLASIDHNAIHSTIQQELKPDYAQKTILAVTL